MSRERWSRVREVLQTVLECDHRQRSAVLDQACSHDSELRASVEALLEHEPALDRFMNPPDTTTLRGMFTEVIDNRAIGRQIGPYKLCEVVASGGMGTVYRAVRADDLYDKQVAIKLIKGGMDAEHVLSRFRQERRVLASLEHPYITALLDAGVTDDGQPYIVMEFVAGQTITEYCEERRLSVGDRLRLFQKVCAAVQHAHQRLVVHRDLKPGNIFVSDEGVPKLLDFGISKIIDPDQAGLPQDQTITVFRLMTPQYSSPEQLRGETITTSSDVYSLGVVLYELLTGHLPHDLRNRTPSEAERVVLETPPERPSIVLGQVTTSRDRNGRTRSLTPESVSRARGETHDKLRRQLIGDLDNIVLMAMRKDPSRRYVSVQQFSDDVQRYLEGKPVTARKDTLGYRTAKFVSRNKMAVAATAAVTISLAIGVVMATVGRMREMDALRQVAAHSQRAEQERERAQKMSEFLRAQLLLLVDAENHDRLEESSREVATQLVDQPGFQADIFTTIGQTYFKLHMFDLAVPHLRDALAARRRVHSEPHAELATAMTAYAQALVVTGELTEAEPLAREALEMRRALPGSGDDDIVALLETLAHIHHFRAQYVEAESFYREALAVYQKHEADWPVEKMAMTLNNLASLIRAKGDHAEAEAIYRELMDVMDAAAASSPHRKEYYLAQKAGMRAGLGRCLTAAGRFAEAERELLASYARIQEAYAPNSELTRQVAAHLSELYRAWGKPGKATEYRRVGEEANP